MIGCGGKAILDKILEAKSKTQTIKRLESQI